MSARRTCLYSGSFTETAQLLPWVLEMDGGGLSGDAQMKVPTISVSKSLVHPWSPTAWLRSTTTPPAGSTS